MCIFLDEFCRLEGVTPTDIKIDVHVAEIDVVKGMKKLLETPILRRIFVEVSEQEPSSLKALGQIIEFGFEVIVKTRVRNYFTDCNHILVRNLK